MQPARRRARRAEAEPPARAAEATLRQTQLASMAAGLLSRVCLHPLDTIKCRVQYLRGQPGAPAVLRFALRDNLYRGILPALAGVLPYSAVYMPYVRARRAPAARRASPRGTASDTANRRSSSFTSRCRPVFPRCSVAGRTSWPRASSAAGPRPARSPACAARSSSARSIR